ncbi:MAG: VTT domain-containing protein [Pseudomonadota bacterium]
MHREKTNGRRLGWGVWLRIGVLALLVVLAIVFWGELSGVVGRTTSFLLDRHKARAYILAHQPYSALYFIGLQIFQVIIGPIPGELTGFLGGVVFGWAWGFLYSTIGLTIGSLINVSLGRAFKRIFLEKIIPTRILDRFEARVHRYGLATVFALFLIPGMPKDIVCYLFGLSYIPIPSFVLAASLARMPGTLVLSLQGAKAYQGDWTTFTIITLAALAVFLPAFFLRDRILKWLGISWLSGVPAEQRGAGVNKR